MSGSLLRLNGWEAGNEFPMATLLLIVFSSPVNGRIRQANSRSGQSFIGFTRSELDFFAAAAFRSCSVL